MKSPSALIFAALIGAILMGNQASAAVLVGGTTNNGNFNSDAITSTTGDRTYAETPFWTHLDGGTWDSATADTLIGGLTDRNMYIRRSSGAFGYSVAGGDTIYSITTGDVFSIAYEWVDGSGWSDANDQMSIQLFTTSDNTIGGTINIIATALSGVKGGNSAASLQTVDQNGFYTATAADNGKTLFMAITSTGTSTNGFARVDNVVLEVVPEPTSALLLLTSVFGFSMRRRR